MTAHDKLRFFLVEEDHSPDKPRLAVSAGSAIYKFLIAIRGDFPSPVPKPDEGPFLYGPSGAQPLQLTVIKSAEAMADNPNNRASLSHLKASLADFLRELQWDGLTDDNIDCVILSEATNDPKVREMIFHVARGQKHYTLKLARDRSEWSLRIDRDLTFEFCDAFSRDPVAVLELWGAEVSVPREIESLLRIRIDFLDGQWNTLIAYPIVIAEYPTGFDVPFSRGEWTDQ